MLLLVTKDSLLLEPKETDGAVKDDLNLLDNRY